MVLSYIGHHDGVALGSIGHSVYHLAHEQRALGGMYGALYHLFVFFGVVGLEAVAPCLVLVFLQQSGDGWQRHFTVAHHGHIGLYILVYLGHINIKVYHLGLLSIVVEATRYAVAEAHAYGNEHVALVLHHVGGQIAVHAQHAHIEGVAAG